MAYLPFATEVGALYTLTSPDGLAVATFNDPLDANYAAYLTDVTGLDSADIRESASDMVEADGGVHGAFYFGRRPVILSGRVFGHTSAQERERRLDLARRASLGLRGDSVLKWVPSVGARQENLLPNPRAANDLTSITAVSGTNTRITGLAAGLPAGVTTGVNVVTSTGSGRAEMIAPTVIGKTYTVSAYMRRNNNLGGAGIYIESNATGLPASAKVTATGAFTRVNFTFVATGSTTVFRARASITGEDFDWTAAMIEEGSDLNPYFDGALSGGVWLGTAHNSTSQDFIEQFVNVRRQQPWRESGGWVKDFQIPLVSELAVIQSTALVTGAAAVALENYGNWPAYPIIQLTGAGTPTSVTDGTRNFTITGLTLAAAEVVEFDMLRHTGTFTSGARAGQSANRYINFATAQWLYLAGQATTQTFSRNGGTGTLSAIRYRHTWA